MTGLEDFAASVGQLNVFGRCDGTDFITAQQEREKREKRARAEKHKRDEVRWKEEYERKKQEEEDLAFALQEQERLNTTHGIEWEIANASASAIGRGNRMLQMMGQSPKPTKMKGRGRSVRYDNQNEPASNGIYLRERNVRPLINQFLGEEAAHSNAVQRQFWHGDRPVDQMPSLSPFALDNFEDARSSSHSPYNQSTQSESSSFQSANSNSNSPVPTPYSTPNTSHNPSPIKPSQPEDFPLLPSSKPTPRKPRNRIAAKFSNMSLEENETNENKPSASLQIHPAVAKSPTLPTYSYGSRSRTGGISINDLRPSQRIIGQDLLRPEELLQNNYTRTQSEFSLNLNEFPSLT